MIAAAFIYVFVQRQIKKEPLKHYATGLQIASIAALVCFYIAGNYFEVRETSIAMFNLDLKEGESIPLGWIFWIFTFIIPVAYIVWGIQKKDAVLLRVGLLLVAAIVFTVRYYYHVLPIEIAAVTGGVFFIGIAYALIKYLQGPKYGFTYKRDSDPSAINKLQLESLVIAQTFTGTTQPATDSGIQFGGGSGGGGGATGEF
jgi:uncharacterized membrane protein YoaK (UPF0700 family)